MDWNAIQVIVRALLQGVAGVLVAKGVVDAAGSETLIGAVLSIGSVVWSMSHKKKIAAGQ